MKKRIFSFIMAMIMGFTMLPVEAIALTTDDNGNAVYEIGDTVWVRGEDGEPAGTTVADAFWLPVYDENDQPVTKQGLCELAEHTHSYVCAQDCALAHTHSEACYSDVYVGCTIHQHSDSCATETVYSCGLTEHSHENCTASEKCTLEEHDHAACETAVKFTCQTEEHTHAACASEVVYSCTIEAHVHVAECYDEGGNLVCGKEEHVHEMTACGGTVNYLCGKSEHTHSVEAGCAYENAYTCGKEAHTHGDGSCVMATTYDCGLTEHTHTESCVPETRYVGCVEHPEHNESCTAESRLTCGCDEHTCVTEGCAPDCAAAEHTHSAECDMEGVYYQWVVVEDTEWTSADFWVLKTSDDGASPLAGAEFELYTTYTNGELSGEITGQYLDGTSNVTGATGSLHFHGFEVDEGKTATFYLKETKAPTNYYANDTVYKVTISHTTDAYDVAITDKDGNAVKFNHRNHVLTVVNTEILGDLTITKAFEDIIPEGIQNITVNVVGDNGYTNTVVLKAAENWTKKLTGLKVGKYTVTEDAELADVTGYDLKGTAYTVDGTTAETAEVVFAETKITAAVTITNDYDKNEAVINNPDSITIVKTDDQGKELAGAVFTLTDGVTERVFTTGADGKIVIDGLIGNGTVTEQSSKEYKLTETTAPVGHVKSDTEWKILVEWNPEDPNNPQIKVVLNKAENRFDTIWDWIVGSVTGKGEWSYVVNQEDGSKQLTIQNPRMTTQVEVSKTVKFEGVDQNDPFVTTHADREYEFRLSYLDDSDKLVTETIKVKGGETKTFNAKIPYGTAYKVEEITEEDFFNAEISDSYTGVIGADDLDANIKVTATNTYSFEVHNDLSIELVKVAADKKRTPLKGAKFALYDEGGIIVETYVSDKNGLFTIEEITAPGEYTLKETKAPDGYYKLKKAIAIDVDYEYTVKSVNGENVIVRTLVAEVSGSGVYQRTDGSYAIKNTEITDNPKTGDQFNMGLWVGIGGAAAAALIVLLILGKKGRK